MNWGELGELGDFGWCLDLFKSVLVRIGMSLP